MREFGHAGEALRVVVHQGQRTSRQFAGRKQIAQHAKSERHAAGADKDDLAAPDHFAAHPDAAAPA